MNILQLLLFAGGVMSLLVIGYMVMAGPSTAKESQRRLQAVRFRHSESTDTKVESQLKKAIAARKPKQFRKAGSGSRIEALAGRLDRTGKGWTVSQYAYTSLGLGLVVAVLIYLQSGAPLLSLGVGVLVGAGLPHMVVGFFIKKRTNQFNTKFPDAIELLVRGLRSGLPVTETLGVVAAEVPGPVGVEFKGVIERIKIGRTMEEALQETADRLDIAEFNFFCITLAIQRETGGNLAETLSNLADVLRKRGQMKLKIRAMSSESKASAYIVGALPFIVFIMIYLINPDYIGGFFTDDRLIVDRSWRAVLDVHRRLHHGQNGQLRNLREDGIGCSINSPDRPCLASTSSWSARSWPAIAAFAVVLAIYAAVTVSDPMAKRVKALNERRDELKAGIVMSTGKKRASLLRNTDKTDKVKDTLSGMKVLQESQIEDIQQKLAHAGYRNRNWPCSSWARGWCCRSCWVWSASICSTFPTCSPNGAASNGSLRSRSWCWPGTRGRKSS